MFAAKIHEEIWVGEWRKLRNKVIYDLDGYSYRFLGYVE